MLFYYGADKIVDKPIYNYGNSSNDYGLGFYLTTDKRMAELWASKNKNGGYVIKYELDINELNVLYLNNSDKESVLKWISLLIRHRFSNDDYERAKSTIDFLSNKYYVDLSNYDLIVGYRADDSYFSYSRDFVFNDLSLEMLKKAMELGNLGLQYVLKSKKAFDKIKIISYEKVPYSKDYESFRFKTLNEYSIIKESDSINNTFIRDIMRGDK